MLNKDIFKSQELVASFFLTEQEIDWEVVCNFFLQLFGAYKLSDTGCPLYLQVMSDWDLMTSDDAAFNALTEICARPELAGCGFSADSKIAYKDFVSSVQDSWQQVKNKIKSSTRFFVDISELENNGLNTCLADSIDTYFAADNHKFYRARIMEKNAVPYTQNQMGMPPVELATAGRANPAGIPYLYTCTDPSTCYYEVRAAYLDMVCVGTFVVKEGKSLKLMNLNQCDRNQQLTTESNPALILRNRILLNSIGKDLSTPMRRHDNPIIEYLPTQFICEYIRTKYEVDGIMFASSVHKDGCNVVFFNVDNIECIDVAEWNVNKIDITATQVNQK